MRYSAWLFLAKKGEDMAFTAYGIWSSADIVVAPGWGAVRKVPRSTDASIANGTYRREFVSVSRELIERPPVSR